jgi:hypothetical protein
LRCVEFIADSSPAVKVPAYRGGTTPRWSFLSLHTPPRYTRTLCLGYRSSFSPTLRLASTIEQPLALSVRSLQPELEGVVVGVAQPGVGLACKGYELPCNVSELTGYVLCGILIISWFAHALSLRTPAHDPRVESVAYAGVSRLLRPFACHTPRSNAYERPGLSSAAFGPRWTPSGALIMGGNNAQRGR